MAITQAHAHAQAHADQGQSASEDRMHRYCREIKGPSTNVQLLYSYLEVQPYKEQGAKEIVEPYE